MTPKLSQFLSDFSLRFGRIDRQLGDCVHDTGNLLVSRDAFVLQPNARIAFRYERGDGVTCERADDIGDAEVSLWFDGFVRGLVAWMGGLNVLHASAVTKDGRTLAFTGPSGAGKSTMAAGLVARGWHAIEDDALVLDGDADGYFALASRPVLRLCDDAFAMVPLERGAEVEHKIGKFAASSPALPVQKRVFPLRDLVLLEFDDKCDGPHLQPVGAVDRLEAIPQALFRDYLVADVIGRDRYGKTLLELMKGLHVARLRRPRLGSVFDRTVDRMERFTAETR